MRPGQNDVYSIGVGVRCLEFLVPKNQSFFLKNTLLVHLNILITIPDLLKIACKLLFRNNHCRVVVVGVETERIVLRQVAVEEEMHMILRVVYKSEG